MRQETSEQIREFQINIDPAVLSDLKFRLNNTRWPHQVKGTAWKAGTDTAYLRNLIEYWQTHYDWPHQERELNHLSHFATTIHGMDIHFVHERGKGPNPFPLLLTHGYPDSFHRFTKLIPMLTDPVRYGGRAEDSFDVVIPDLPGYAFSSKPQQAGTIFEVSKIWAILMEDVLGYQYFGAHGGDWGSTVTEQLARDHGDMVRAIHLTDVPFGHIFQKPKDLTSAEERFFKETDKWMQKEGAYALIQSTKPQSLAVGVNDSPAGLASWLLEKFRSWSDCGGEVESRFSKDELLTHIMIYWVTASVGSSFLPYFDYANASALTWIGQGVKNWIGTSKTPAAFAMFPKDISQPPREWAERFFNVQRWTRMPRGGHFAAMEEPQLLAEDLQTWFRGYR